MKSYLSHLECSRCGQHYSASKPHNVCPACGKVLLARYDLVALKQAFSRDELSHRPASMWRYYELMPVSQQQNVVSLGEGMTPLLKAERLGESLGCDSLFIKDEGTNPTGTFKSRGLSAAVSKAKELGIKSMVMPTAGNAGSALAAYAARAGIEAHVFMPDDTPAMNKVECLTYGAHCYFVKGNISDAGKAARESGQGKGWFDASTFKEPYRVEGKKTMGIELAEQLGWSMPDAIIYPAGGGTGLVGIWKAFDELEALGWLKGKRPRMIAVQSAGCAPIVSAFSRKREFAEAWTNPATIATGLKVPAPFADYLILKVLYDSQGTAVAASEEQIVAAIKEMARLEGVLACPEGAATLAALKYLLGQGFLSPKETIVLLNTGSGLKYPEVISATLPEMAR